MWGWESLRIGAMPSHAFWGEQMVVFPDVRRLSCTRNKLRLRGHGLVLWPDQPNHSLDGSLPRLVMGPGGLSPPRRWQNDWVPKRCMVCDYNADKLRVIPRSSCWMPSLVGYLPHYVAFISMIVGAMTLAVSCCWRDKNREPCNLVGYVGPGPGWLGTSRSEEVGSISTGSRSLFHRFGLGRKYPLAHPDISTFRSKLSALIPSQTYQSYHVCPWLRSLQIYRQETKAKNDKDDKEKNRIMKWKRTYIRDISESVYTSHMNLSTNIF